MGRIYFWARGKAPMFFHSAGVFSGFWGIGLLLFFHCFFIVFPLFLCWNICWNVGCVVFVVLIVDVCVVILVHHQKWCPIPINIGVRKNDEKYLTKRWWLYYCLWGEWFVCLFVCCWNNEEHVQMSNEQMREREGDIHLQEHEASFGNDEAYLQ